MLGEPDPHVPHVYWRMSAGHLQFRHDHRDWWLDYNPQYEGASFHVDRSLPETPERLALWTALMLCQ